MSFFSISLEGEQQFELAVGANVTVTNITKPIGVAATSQMMMTWEDWERMDRIHEKWAKIKHNLSSHFTYLVSDMSSQNLKCMTGHNLL